MKSFLKYAFFKEELIFLITCAFGVFRFFLSFWPLPKFIFIVLNTRKVFFGVFDLSAFGNDKGFSM